MNAGYTYARDDDASRIRVTARQPLDADDLIGIIKRQVDEGTWHYDMLYDLRAIGAGVTSREDAAIVNAYVCQYTDSKGVRGRVAIVSRMYNMIAAGSAYAREAQAHGGSMQVFWDLDDAVEWLDRHAPGEKPVG